jgi:hypothetical protein
MMVRFLYNMFAHLKSLEVSFFTPLRNSFHILGGLGFKAQNGFYAFYASTLSTLLEASSSKPKPFFITVAYINELGRNLPD